MSPHHPARPRRSPFLLSLLALLATAVAIAVGLVASAAQAASAPALPTAESAVGRPAPLASAHVRPNPLRSLNTPQAIRFAYDRIAVATGVAAKAVPNPYGRLGSPAHRARIGDAEERFADQGWKTISGGSRPEVRYGSRYPDLVMERDGKTIAIQVGRKTKSGVPVARERRALDDLRGTGEFVLLHEMWQSTSD